MQFWQQHTLVKPNKLQTGLFYPLKVSLSFSVLKYETRAFKRIIEIKPIPILFILLNISRLPRTITSDIVARFSRRILCTIPPAMLLVHAFSCALSSYGALAKLELPSAIASGNSYASFVLSKLPACSITRQCSLKHEPIFKYTSLARRSQTTLV